MKGPGHKLTHDVRRTWQCPSCGGQRKVAGDVTSLVCRCRDQGTFMTLVSERTVAPRPQYSSQGHDVRSAEFGIDDLPVLQPHPSSLPPERTGPRRPRPGSDASLRQVPETAGPPDAAGPADTPAPETPSTPSEPKDDWGEGIL